MHLEANLAEVVMRLMLKASININDTTLIEIGRQNPTEGGARVCSGV
jgi:hypothetical protein